MILKSLIKVGVADVVDCIHVLRTSECLLFACEVDGYHLMD